MKQKEDSNKEFAQFLKKIRSKTDQNIPLEEITAEVEKVRGNRQKST